RNLVRYTRRTLLMVSLIAISTVFVLVFISVTTSFKNMMIGQITDSMMGHIQVHRKGYTASIDNLPLTISLQTEHIKKLEKIIYNTQGIEDYSERIKFAGIFSNFIESTGIRLNAVDPEKEFKTIPMLTSRIIEGQKNLKKGEILLPLLLAKGMNVKIDDPVVIIVTNKDGSVNGKQFKVEGILESAVGPSGRDGYIHIDDGIEILRMEKPEISEVAFRLKDINKLHQIKKKLQQELAGNSDKKGKAIFEVHSWEDLHPFYNIVSMINMMIFFVNLMLILIVLISVMNVMIMAVYERMREIGTLTAIGTLPGKIRSLFLLEGIFIGLGGALIGDVLSIIIILILRYMKITFSFGRTEGLILSPSVDFFNILTISVILIIISALASLQPAIKASQLDPVTALRHV
ncbi:MAG: FtsX-like permease family protein, partial [Candidatus Eremiobacterota bacterium]